MRNDERHLVKIKDAVKQILTVMLCVGIIVTSMPTSAFASVEDDFGTDTVQRIQDSDDAAGTEDIVSPVTNPEGTAAGGSASEEPTVEEPTVEEPTEIISDEPENTEGTVLNEPTAEDPTAEDPAAEDPTAEDPAAPVDTQAEREQIIAEIEAAIAALPAPETLTAEMVEGDTDLTRSLDHLDELFRTLETFLNEDEEDALSLLSGEAQAYYLAVLNAVGALAEQSTLAEESIVITEKKSWSFDWIWDDAIAREHNLITRPEGPITGWVRWLASTIDDGPLCIEENALAKIKVTVKSEDGTVVLPEETTLAEFYHNFCGYSWRDIHDQNLLGMDEKANADDPNSVLIAPVHEKYPEDDGVGEFIFAFSKAGQSYTVTYSVEPTGANSDYTVTSEQVDGRWVLTAASNVDEKVLYIETLIEGLSAAGDITADMKEEEFNLLKSKLEALDGQLADLKSLLGENEIEPLSLLSDAAQSKYNLVKNAYRLTEIEKRIAEVQVMNLEGLSPDGISALRTELNGLMMEAVDLRNFFGEDQLDLYKRAETARSTLRNQISSLNGDNILLNASKITVSSLNGDAVTFTWQWNDQNIQQVGASRPTGNLLGSMSLDENGKPVTTDSYMNVTVYVTGAGATESMSLLEFLCDVCGYDGAYIQEHFADLVAANDETRTSDSRGGSVVFTWNPGRLITAYTDEYGNPFTVSYGVEPGNEIPGYQVTQSEDNLILTATPATDFNATVIWYDNRNQYEDEQGNNTRPTPETYKTELQVVRVYTNAEGEKVTETFPGENYNIDIVTHTGDDSHPDETWDISLPGLPKYGPNGELYTYYLKQITDDTTGKLPSEVNTGAAYTPSVYNGGLLDTEHPEYIANNGQVTNTLSREDKVTIKKMWNDNAIDPENRPETTLYFYRVAETEVVQKNEATGDYEIIGFKGSPVPNYDSISGIEDMEPDAAGYTTVSLPNDGTTLPMFDNYGRRYIYFAVEQMSDKGDYVTQIDDTKAGPILLIPEELELVRQEAGKLNYILNGATVNNKLESTVNVPVTVDFRAQAIQNNMENTTVTLQLQYWDTSIEAWQSYFKIYEDGTEYDGTLTLEDFHPETTTLSGSSEPVDKYDPNGNKIQYRWVQTNMTVNDGTPVDPLKTDGEDWEDLNQENVELTNTGSAVVGPGVGDDKTTLYFDIQYGEDEDGFTTITNILVGNTQVKASKTWIYKETKDDGTAGKTYVYPGGNWDGTSIDDADAVLPAGAKWPYELTLTYDVLRNGAPYLGENREPVTLTMEAGTTEATLPGLPRYDQNGNEYEYTLVEHVPDGWDSSRSYTNSVENDLSEGRDGDQVTQLNGNFNNYIGPGKILTFEVSKNWEDDTDIETRYPVQVAVFNIETGKMVENTLHTLELSNKWNVQISIDAEDDDTVDNYIVKEVQVGPDGVGVPVQYSYSDTELAELAELAKSFYEDQVEKGDPFIENQYNQDALEKYIAGTLAADGTDENGILEFYYNVYLSVNQTGNDHEYCTIYNQRYAEQEMLLEKTWVNNGQKSTASFVLERQEGDEWKTVETFELSTENKTVDNGTVKASWSSKEEKLNLPKYDARGALYNYQIRETEMSIVDGSGAELTHEIVDGIADFSEGENGKPNADRYTCIVSQDSPEYAQNKWLENEKQGASPHHSGDIFTWSGRNVRRDSNDITVYKVWRDGAGPLNEQDPANRPDICFHLYRLSHNQLLDIMGDTSTGELSTDQLDACVNWMKDTFTSESSIQGYVEAGSIQRVNEDYFWTTSTVSGVEGAKVNNWLWKCDLSEAVDRYASDGSPYIYFLFEEMRGNSDGYQASYCNEEKDVIWKEGSEAGIKGGEASTTEGTFNWEKNMDSSFLLISDGGVRGRILENITLVL